MSTIKECVSFRSILFLAAYSIHIAIPTIILICLREWLSMWLEIILIEARCCDYLMFGRIIQESKPLLMLISKVHFPWTPMVFIIVLNFIPLVVYASHIFFYVKGLLKSTLIVLTGGTTLQDSSCLCYSTLIPFLFCS